MGKKRVIKKSTDAGTDPVNRGKSRLVDTGERGGRKIIRGIAYIQATYNNTLMSITDDRGNVMGWASAGSIGFSGTKKATPFAAARVAEALVEKVRKSGLQEVSVMVKGVGSGRDSAVRALANQGLTIIAIKDITPLPHNGPRPKKVRRV